MDKFTATLLAGVLFVPIVVTAVVVTVGEQIKEKFNEKH